MLQSAGAGTGRCPKWGSSGEGLRALFPFFVGANKILVHLNHPGELNNYQDLQRIRGTSRRPCLRQKEKASAPRTAYMEHYTNIIGTLAHRLRKKRSTRAHQLSCFSAANFLPEKHGPEECSTSLKTLCICIKERQFAVAHSRKTV